MSDTATPTTPGANFFDGKSIFITGATGSFGRQCVKTILSRYQPRRLVVYSRDELKQYEMAQERGIAGYPSLRFFIGDVRDANRLDMAMRDIDIVIHAAALKHVPTAEYNPFECIHTNVLGAENVVQAAIRNGVDRVLALSTDKAANPVNLYGASKLASDKIFVAANHLSGSTRALFSVVRYGNVVGSRGSVVPLYQRLLNEGVTRLPVTDPRMTRFWITLQAGVDFVLASLQTMRGAEIFVPKIPSMRMVDLAGAMSPGTEHDIIGIRPGEKLHEVMVTEDDARTTIESDDCYIIEPGFAFWDRHSWADDGWPLVADGFRYASDSNSQWLSQAELLNILAQAKL